MSLFAPTFPTPPPTVWLLHKKTSAWHWLRKCLKCRRAFKCVFDTRWNVLPLDTGSPSILQALSNAIFHFHLPAWPGGVQSFSLASLLATIFRGGCFLNFWLNFSVDGIECRPHDTPPAAVLHLLPASVYLSVCLGTIEWMNSYETDVLFYSVACSEHCLWKRSSSTLSLPSLSILLYFCQTASRRNCLGCFSSC